MRCRVKMAQTVREGKAEHRVARPSHKVELRRRCKRAAGSLAVDLEEEDSEGDLKEADLGEAVAVEVEEDLAAAAGIFADSIPGSLMARSSGTEATPR